MYVDKERRNRVVALVLAIVLVAGVVLALLATIGGAASASAATPLHATLSTIVPADGAHLDRAPSQIVLTFDEAVSPDLAQVVLTHDGQPVDVSTPAVHGSQVSASVGGDPGPGAYRIAWQVTSDDGHPVSGEARFEVRGAAGAGPRPHVTPTYKTPQMQPTTFAHPDHAPGLIVAGVLLLGGLALMAYEHRRRKNHEDQPIS